MSPDDSRLWEWRRAAPVRQTDRFIILALVGAGLLLIVRFADWWFTPAHVARTGPFVVLSLAVWYGVLRMVVGWVGALGLTRPEHRPAPPGLSVAIFTTSSPGEPLEMFEATLAACARIRYAHTTYLLDDTGDPAFAETARRHGAVPLELVGLPGAKAGKINAALGRTEEPFILVLDPDHIPFPAFLDRVLGHFDDPEIGFVQVAQAYYNQARSFTARAAAEQTYAFYGPTQMGLHGHGCSVAIGANCTFRRGALESIGGHGVGLAEDLVTSIRLHAEGWRSVYVPEIVSRGLVPEDLGSFHRQQLKWARGVYEVLFAEIPRAFGRLGWRQRFSYLTIGTYYLFGVTTMMYLVVPYVFLWTGIQPASMLFGDFVAAGGPVAIVGVSLYLLTQRWLVHPQAERGLHWRGLFLKVACWPVYLAGTVLALLRADLPYVPTVKGARRRPFLPLAAPHLVLAAIYASTLFWTIYRRAAVTPEAILVLSSEAVWGMVAFATLSMAMVSGGIRAAWEGRTPPARGPWQNIDVEMLGGAGSEPAPELRS